MQLQDGERASPWGECYYDHFRKYLGNPTGRMIFNRDDSQPWMQIISYDNIFGGCKAFCSFGLSHYVLQIGEIAEVFMPVDDGWDDTPSILAYSLLHLVQGDAHLGRGLAVRFADIFPDFVSKFDKSAVYFADPFGLPEDFKHVRCGSRTGEVYMVCYISEAEFHFREKNGTESFEELFEEKQVDVFNIKRKPSI